MKKLFTFVSLLFIAMSAFAVNSSDSIGIDETILNEDKNLIAMPEGPRSHFASIDSMTDMELTLIGWDYSGAAQVPLESNASDEEWNSYFKGGWADKITYGPKKQPVCKMVKISSNWLIGDSHCLPEYIRNNPTIN